MIDHIHRTIFVHIPKTAGQAIERIFLAHLGLEWRLRSALLLRARRPHESGPPRLAHLTAAQYCQHNYVSTRQFSEYFKFSIVRNPWDRTYSMYQYLGYSEKMSLEEFVKTVLQDEEHDFSWFMAPQSDYIYDVDGNSKVDFIGKYERLQDDFDFVSDTLGLLRTDLPVINKTNNEVSKNPLHLEFTSKAKDIVLDFYAEDFTNFGYGS